MTGKASPDWERIELDYRAGVKTLREIADKSGITHAAICKRAKNHAWTRRPRAAPRRVVLDQPSEVERPREGFLYVIYIEPHPGQRFFKIGKSINFVDRRSTHQCSSPFEVCVACCYFTGDAAAEEAWLHSQYAKQRHRGEWFVLSDEDLEDIVVRGLLTRVII